MTTSLNQQPVQFEARVHRTAPLNYLLYLPNGGGAPSSSKPPLLLYLHGAGERGSDLALVAKHGPPSRVAQGHSFPFILVSPQCPSGDRWHHDDLIALLDDVEARYDADRSRVYLTGLSMGGYGAWSLAVLHPDRFAAVIPVCGGGNGIDVILADGPRKQALQSLPIWAFHGARDDVVPVSESERMLAALQRAGANNARLTVYPDADHDSYTRTYQNPEIYEWLLRQQRK